MTLHANLRLVDQQGMQLAEEQRLLKLHELIFRLPWQHALWGTAHRRS